MRVYVVASGEGLGSVRFASSTSFSTPFPITKAICSRHIHKPFNFSRRHKYSGNSPISNLEMSHSTIKAASNAVCLCVRDPP